MERTFKLMNISREWKLSKQRNLKIRGTRKQMTELCRILREQNLLMQNLLTKQKVFYLLLKKNVITSVTMQYTKLCRSWDVMMWYEAWILVSTTLFLLKICLLVRGCCSQLVQQTFFSHHQPTSTPTVLIMLLTSDHITKLGDRFWANLPVPVITVAWINPHNFRNFLEATQPHLHWPMSHLASIPM